MVLIPPTLTMGKSNAEYLYRASSHEIWLDNDTEKKFLSQNFNIEINVSEIYFIIMFFLVKIILFF